MRGLRERLSRLSVDLGPWRGSKDFRILLISGTVFFLGGMVGYVALPYQLYQLTGSNFAVGAMGLVTIAPLVIFGLYGGALADHLDRRKTLIATGIAQAAIVAVVLANSLLAHPQVWVIYVCGALTAIATSLQRPSREALLPRVVKHQEMAAAVALSSLTMQVGQLAGPALGGRRSSAAASSASPAWSVRRSGRASSGGTTLARTSTRSANATCGPRPRQPDSRDGAGGFRHRTDRHQGREAW